MTGLVYVALGVVELVAALAIIPALIILAITGARQ